jgi:hypothetical protein
MAPARPADHASRMASSRVRLSESRRICLSTAAIIREAQVTINRTLNMLGIGLPTDAAHNVQKGARSNPAAAGVLQQRAGDEDDSAVGSG